MNRNSNEIRSLLKVLPHDLRDALNEILDCMKVAPRTVVESCRTALVYTIHAVGSLTPEAGGGVPPRQAIIELQNLGVISKKTAAYMHAIMTIRNTVCYDRALLSAWDTDLCVRLLTAVLRDVFPIHESQTAPAEKAVN